MGVWGRTVQSWRRRPGACRAAAARWVMVMAMVTTVSLGAQTPAPRRFDIPAQALATALTTFGQQSGLQVSAQADLVAGRTATAVKGELSAEDALRQLLTGTELTFRLAGTTVTLMRESPPAHDAVQLGAVRIAGEGQGRARLPASVSSDPAATESTGLYTTPSASIMKGLASLKEIPQSVSVMTRQRMEEQNLFTLEGVLDHAPGVYKVPGRGRIRDSDALVYSRGYQIQSYMVDGVSTQGDPGTSAASVIGTEAAISGSSAIYDRVEVLRGAAGLLIGQGQPGGSVNLVRKRGTRQFQQRYMASAGAWDSYHAQVDLGGPVTDSGNVRFRVVGDYDNSGRYWNYTPTSSEAPLLYGLLDIDLGARTRLGIGGRYEPYQERATPRATYQSNWGHSDSDSREVFVDLHHHFGPRWEVNVAARHQRQEIDLLLARMFFPQTSNWRAEVQSKMTDVKTTAVDASALGAFDALGREHRLTVGFNASDTQLLIRRSELGSGARDFEFVFDPANPQIYDPETSWLDARSRVPAFRASVEGQIPENTTTWSPGFYGKLDFRLLDRLTAIVGARASRFDYELVYGDYTASWSGAPVGTVQGDSGTIDVVTPYAGLVFQVTSQWSAYASYADIFRPQFGRFTRAGERVKHVTGANYEAGLKGEMAGGRLNAAVALFQIDERNTTMADEPPFDRACSGNPSGGGCVVPLGHSRSRGFEAEMSGEVRSGWQIAASYTRLNTEIVRADSGQGLPMLNWGVTPPKHLFKLWTSYRFDDGMLRGLMLGGGTNAISSRALRDYSLRIPAYGVCDVFSRYAVTRNLTVSLNVNNLLQERYIYDADGYRFFSDDLTLRSNGPVNDSLYGPGRSATVSLQVKF